MMFIGSEKASKLSRSFILPNEIFEIGLDGGAILIYAYLLRCEDRKTHQCYPSYKIIGNAVGMSENTVRKYVSQLVDRKLISTENTMVYPRSSHPRNGNLMYTIAPFKPLAEEYMKARLDKLELDAARARWERQQAQGCLNEREDPA